MVQPQMYPAIPAASEGKMMYRMTALRGHRKAEKKQGSEQKRKGRKPDCRYRPARGWWQSGFSQSGLSYKTILFEAKKFPLGRSTRPWSRPANFKRADTRGVSRTGRKPLSLPERSPNR